MKLNHFLINIGSNIRNLDIFKNKDEDVNDIIFSHVIEDIKENITNSISDNAVGPVWDKTWEAAAVIIKNRKICIHTQYSVLTSLKSSHNQHHA